MHFEQLGGNLNAGILLGTESLSFNIRYNSYVKNVHFGIGTVSYAYGSFAVIRQLILF
jgi:hypothetical protein